MPATLCFFGEAGSDGEAPAGFVYKLMGAGATEGIVQLVLEVTNGTRSYCSKFSLQSLIDEAVEEAGLEPSANNMLAWLQEHFDAGEVDADVGSGGELRLAALHSWEGMSLNIRLPPGPQGMQPLKDQQRSAWVAQELLFSQAACIRGLSRRVEACEQRCPLEKQFEELLAFLAAGEGGKEGAKAAAEAAAAALEAVEDSHEANGVCAAPTVAHIQSKRKLRELREQAAAAAAPASGSAVKAPRPAGSALQVAPAAAPAAGRPEPASTQQTGAMSNATQHTDTSYVSKPKRIKQRQTGKATRVGPARK